MDIITQTLVELFPNSVNAPIELQRNGDGVLEFKTGYFFNAALDSKGYVEGVIIDTGKHVFIKEVAGEYIVLDRELNEEIEKMAASVIDAAMKR